MVVVVSQDSVEVLCDGGQDVVADVKKPLYAPRVWGHIEGLLVPVDTWDGILTETMVWDGLEVPGGGPGVLEEVLRSGGHRVP